MLHNIQPFHVTFLTLPHSPTSSNEQPRRAVNCHRVKRIKVLLLDQEAEFKNQSLVNLITIDKLGRPRNNNHQVGKLCMIADLNFQAERNEATDSISTRHISHTFICSKILYTQVHVNMTFDHEAPSSKLHFFSLFILSIALVLLLNTLDDFTTCLLDKFTCVCIYA